MKYDAELFVFGGMAAVGVSAMGYIYSDSKLRFRDGEMITTSTVLSIDGDIVKTRNTTYKAIKEMKA
tara:strand:+ start:2676 stop:2876 length:201 start_codon:yes stop_codon:yes gene_type:complete